MSIPQNTFPFPNTSWDVRSTFLIVTIWYGDVALTCIEVNHSIITLHVDDAKMYTRVGSISHCLIQNEHLNNTVEWLDTTIHIIFTSQKKVKFVYQTICLFPTIAIKSLVFCTSSEDNLNKHSLFLVTKNGISNLILWRRKSEWFTDDFS